MISPAFYQPVNKVKKFLGAKVAHYPRKDRSITLTSYDHFTQDVDTMPTLARQTFGATSVFMWTIIADNNRLEYPDEIRLGEKIKLPDIVLSDPIIIL